jgi:long-chain acyl-CoA synthetase
VWTINRNLLQSLTRQNSNQKAQQKSNEKAVMNDIYDKTIPDVLDERASRTPDYKMLQFKNQDGEWVYKTPRQVQSDVMKVAKGLIAKGVKSGDKVAIMSHTSYQWILLDYATTSIGAVTVPIYETSSLEQIRYIVHETGAVLLFVENEELYKLVTFVQDKLKHLRKIYIIDHGGLDSIISSGVLVKNADFFARRKAIQPADIATIVFTSGSTGRPKGVVLTHTAFVTCAAGANDHLPELLGNPKGKLLLFLPLAHIFARFCVTTLFMSEACITLSANLDTLLTDLRKIRPTLLLGVPRVFEKVYNAASQKAGKGIKGMIFRNAVQTAVRYSKITHDFDTMTADAHMLGIEPVTNQVQSGKYAVDVPETPNVPISLRLKRFLYSRVVYKELKKALGGKLTYCVCGGAPLNPNTNHFFNGIGITVLEGYGLTETAAPVSVNKVPYNRIGTVGVPFPGVEFKIADDSELLIKTPSIFTSYFKDEKATKHAFTADGYYKTGDLGKLSEDGFLTIIGRKKSLIITAGGKNVTPEPLENEIEKNKIVASAIVLGDRKPFISALVTLDPDALVGWLKENNLPHDMSLEDAAQNPAVRSNINRSVLSANKLVSRAESVRKFVILPKEFSLEDGTLTPSQKVSRPIVLERWSEVVESQIYRR